MESTLTPIPARTKRQAMDWSLALASQEIGATIVSAAPRGWFLLVQPEDHARALETIRLFRLENRFWFLNRRSPRAPFRFHGGALLWGLVLVLLHGLGRGSWFCEVGGMDSVAVASGEWWRVFTAMFLHADWGHAMANATLGVVLFGMAMGEYGAGVALFLAFLAGGIGNAVGYAFYSGPYRSVGASGMVMGGLGLMAAQSTLFWRQGRLSGRQVVRGVVAGLMLFILLGLNPTTDVLAHSFGFFGGMFLGACHWLCLPWGRLKLAAGRASWILLAGMVGWVLWLAGMSTAATAQNKYHGTQFIGLDRFSDFRISTENESKRTFLESWPIESAIEWDQLVMSWNMRGASNRVWRIEARPIVAGAPGPYFTMGIWSSDKAAPGRGSVRKQSNDIGQVQTDVLLLKKPATAVQVRISANGSGGELQGELKLVGLCFLDSRIRLGSTETNRLAWGKTTAVPELSQMEYAEGKGWCSPTCATMLLQFWEQVLHRSDLKVTVPQTAENVHDPQWPGTGNWPFNTAYAGSFPGVRAYVTRFSGIDELEAWTSAGVPVVVSVSYGLLKGKTQGTDGHLVVCVGFTPDGDPVMNDPGTRLHVRKTFPRANLELAWAASRRTVYLIYPDHWQIPEAHSGHWMGKTTLKQ